MTADVSPLSPPPRVTWLDLLAIALVTAAAFIPVLWTDFAPLDDMAMIVLNPDVTTPSWETFANHWSTPSFRIYMPLTLSVWQLIATLTHVGERMSDGTYQVLPGAYKTVSVGAHALAAVAAAWSLSTITRTRWPAVLGALFFALHPTQVESVAWTTGLKDVLCGLFSFLAIGCYTRHARRSPVTPWGDGWWWGALLSALLAMASKSSASVLPATLLAVDVLTRRCSLAKRVVSFVPILIPGVISLMIIVSTQGDSRSSVVPLWQRPFVAGDAYAFYLRKVVWPGALSIDYGRRPIDIMTSGAIWWTWLLAAAAFIGVLLTRSRLWLMAAALFVIPILPVSGLATFDMQQYSTVTDHYLYQPLFGAGLAVALLAAWRPAVGGVIAAALVPLAIFTYRESTAWQSVENVYGRMVVPNPRSWMARNLIGDLAADRGDLFTARRMIRQALELNPEGANTHDLLSRVEVLTGNYRTAATHAMKASRNPDAHRLSLALRLTMLGLRLNDRDVSETGLRIWQEREPQNQFVKKMIADVERSKRQDRSAASTKTTAPTP